MKNIFYISLIIILLTSCRKDKEIVSETATPTMEIINTLRSGNSCTRFERVFKGYKSEEFRSVKQTADGGYILCGATQTIAQNEYDVLLIKTDCFGATEWMKTISNSYSDFGYDVIPLSSGGYLVMANITKDPNSWKIISHQGQFIEVDKAGDLVSKADFKIGVGTVINKVIEAADGNLLISGRDDDESFIVKADRHGSQIWIKRGLYDICPHNKNYLACGTTKINNKAGIYVLEMNTDGDTLWTKSFDKNIDSGASLITTLSNNEIAIGGTYRTSNTTFAGFIMRLDATGKEIWYKSLEADGIQNLINVVATSNNDIVTVGTKTAGGINIVKLDFNTDSIIWNVSKFFNPIIQGFQLTTDEGFIIVGTLFNGPGNGDGYVLKTDKDGN